MRFLHHSQVINYLIQRFNFKTYLEIGVHNPSGNFNLINCDYKVGVDPSTVYGTPTFIGTSDDFFEQNKETFDIIFLDGLHHADQLDLDLLNAITILNEGGFILMHDTNPQHEKYTHIPRDVKGRWNGDCYKVLIDLTRRGGLNYRTLSFDANGLTVVKIDESQRAINNDFSKDWDTFVKNRNEIAKLVTDEEFMTWIL